MNTITNWLMALALLSGPAAARADMVNVVISGQLTALSAGGDNPLSPDIALGESYVWSFTYNTAAQLGGNTDTILSSSLTIGSLSWGLGIEGVAQVLNIGGTQAAVGPFDEYDFEIARPAGPNLTVNSSSFYAPGTFQWSISAPQVLEGDFPSAIVPTAAQLLNAVATTSSANDFTTLNWSNEYVTGSVTSVQIDGTSVSPVPLPAAPWLLLSGLGALGFLAQKRVGYFSSVL